MLYRIINFKMFQNTTVGRFLGAIRPHSPNFLFSGAIISFGVSSIGSGKRVLANKYRTLVTSGARNVNGKYRAFGKNNFLYIGIVEEIDANFSSIIDRIPEIFFDTFDVFQAADYTIILNAE